SGTPAMGEMGLNGWTVQLLNDSGEIVDSTTTQRDGVYHFDGLDIGSYRVNVIDQANWKHTTPPPTVITITRGINVDRVDFGMNNPALVKVMPPPPPPPSGPLPPPPPL